MQQSRAVACLYVDFIIPMDSCTFVQTKQFCSAFQEYPNAKVGNGEEMEVDQPKEGRCIVLREVSRTESFEAKM